MTAAAWRRRLGAFVVALIACGCASDAIVPGIANEISHFPIAPYERHQACATLAKGDRLDYRFDATSPVTFHLYYKVGATFLSPVSRDDVTEFAGVFLARDARRYCLQWEAGRQGAYLDYRIRLLREGDSR
ncbi:MAG: hypothetical protein IT521_07580 [Burkholderiales bacterium]|nr:hypothetical protein [Burkholderiales bacterium]